MDIEKNTTGYGVSRDNFAITNDGYTEITVTITLNEYRDLVSSKAKAEQYATDSEKWRLLGEIKELKNQIKTLQKAMRGSSDDEDDDE